MFASWLGWITDLDRPVFIVAGADQDRDEIVRQALDIGHDSIVGELDGGIDASHTSSRPIGGIALVAPADIVGAVIDVRQHRRVRSPVTCPPRSTWSSAASPTPRFPTVR